MIRRRLLVDEMFEKEESVKKESKKPRMPWRLLLAIGLIMSLVVIGTICGDDPELLEQELEEMTYIEFLEKVNQQEVSSIRVDLKSGAEMVVTLTDETKVTVPNPKTETFKVDMLEAGIEVEELNRAQLLAGLSSFVSIGMMMLLLYILTKNVNPFGSKKPITEKPQTRFCDIAGMDEIKEELALVVEFLKQPERFKEQGAKLPKGIILYGNPGTGKTLLARAIAGEANVPFFNASGSEFIELFAGVGARRVRDLFKEARESAPSIIFIDEIDAVGGQRDKQIGNGEGRQTINALLAEMDGFQESEGVIVICATNRLEDLDSALIRPGRFDKHIHVPLPQTAHERLEILNLYKKGRTFADDLDFETLAKETLGFSPADLEVLINEATLISIQTNKSEIDQACLDEALYKKLLKGHAKKNHDRTPEDVELIAWHEAGHAVMAHLMDIEVSKVTITPSTSGAGGVNFIIPKRLGLYSLEELEAQVRVNYAGRGAEYLLVGTKHRITTGAQADIEQATRILYQLVVEQGMSETYGMLNLNLLQVESTAYLPELKQWSLRLEEETSKLLRQHQDKVERVAKALIEKETLSKPDLQALLNDTTERSDIEKTEESSESERAELSPEKLEA